MSTELEPIELSVSNGDGTVSNVSIVSKQALEKQKADLAKTIRTETSERANQDTFIKKRIEAANKLSLAKPLEDESLLFYFDTVCCDGDMSTGLEKMYNLSTADRINVGAYGFLPKEQDNGRDYRAVIMGNVTNYTVSGFSKTTNWGSMNNKTFNFTAIAPYPNYNRQLSLYEYLGFNDLYYGTYKYDRVESFSISFMANIPQMPLSDDRADIFRFGDTRTIAIQQTGWSGIRLIVNTEGKDNDGHNSQYCSAYVRPTYGIFEFFTVTFNSTTGKATWYKNGEVLNPPYPTEEYTTGDLAGSDGKIKPFVDGGIYMYFLQRGRAEISPCQLAYFGLHNKCLTQDEVRTLYKDRAEAHYLEYSAKSVTTVLKDINKRLEFIENGGMFITY